MSIATRARFAVLAVGLVIGLTGCLGSKLSRHVVDVSSFRAWGGQVTQVQPDTLIPARVEVRQRVPEILDGSAQGIEEVALFVQLQNLEATPTEVAVYAMRGLVHDRETVIEEGIRITKAIAIDGQSAIQLDARNYPSQSAGFDEFVPLILGGDFYLYVISTAGVYNVAANVPSLALLVTSD